MKRITVITTAMLLAGMVSAQSDLYQPVEIRHAIAGNTRTIEGVPGEAYWQNTSEYDLKVELDPLDKKLKGSGTICYFNNSPDSLRYMVVKLLQNINKKGNPRDYGADGEQLNDGVVIDSIVINGIAEDLDNRSRFREWGTNLYVIFGRAGAIPPGAKTEIYLAWNYQVVMHGMRNGAYTDSAFFIGYWYPQIAVYDDIYGWDRESYTGKQETYNDLASYSVEIMVPENYIVWATGDHLNEKKIFSEQTLDLIKSSRKSSTTVNILKAGEYSEKDVFRKGRDKTWKFKATDVPDFAWACSNYYNWDANTLKLAERDVWINAVYPPGTESFDQVATVAHNGIKYLSDVFPGIPYPFEKHITFNGIQHVAVEYPMMANNSDYAQEEMYEEITVHEIAHNYIPFYMLSNERRHAWIDEGWVKLSGEMYGESKGLKREDKQGLNTIHAYESVAGCLNDLPLIVPSGNMAIEYNFQLSYAKAANADHFLLELMKEKGIEDPLRQFLLAWKGKHPTPYDFFNFMETLCGEDLAWYWNKWYFTFNAPDLALDMNDNGQAVVSNIGGIPLPVILKVEYDDGSSASIDQSIWVWSKGDDSIIVDIPDTEKVVNISLGAGSIPDIDKSNNVWQRSLARN